MKMSIFKIPTWRTAAILKIVIATYLSRESSEFDEIWYADANIEQGDGNVTKIPVIPKFKMADGRHIENHFVAITRLHIVRLRRNLEFSMIARKRRLGAKNVKFRKSNIGDGRHFENHYISISQPQIVRISRNLVCRHKFYPRRRKRDKKSEIPKFKMADGRRIENHFLAITQLHVVPLR